jgi:hypothetical protein
MNNMTNSPGRLCNHIIRAHAASFLSKRGNIRFNYGYYYDKMKRLGILLYTSGTTTYANTIVFNNDDEVNDMILDETKLINSNININNCYCQNKLFSNYLYNYYKNNNIRQSIINSNIFKNRYYNNQDVYVHVRLDDAQQWNQGFKYYDKCLSTLNFNNGYISSDSIDHNICIELIKKYNLKAINYDEITTIMFGSTCKYVLLTGGSYSFIIGLFSFFSKVYYLKGFDNWYPSSLFHIDDWTEVNI